MRKIYYLATCDTCKKILKEIAPAKDVLLQDIKTEAITAEQLDEMYKMAGSYEGLFSKVALKYRQWGLNEKKLSENDYRDYILQEYTFLKRPVMLADGKIFIGNAPKSVQAAKPYFQ